mmetsp:Transcript_1872/g.4402  ORF Transcript_1872/g.4402 Transcript_1872/m.4402 type:complete len:366 (-) Transcript_1872:17-1114(-)
MCGGQHGGRLGPSLCARHRGGATAAIPRCLQDFVGDVPRGHRGLRQRVGGSLCAEGICDLLAGGHAGKLTGRPRRWLQHRRLLGAVGASLLPQPLVVRRGFSRSLHHSGGLLGERFQEARSQRRGAALLCVGALGQLCGCPHGEPGGGTAFGLAQRRVRADVSTAILPVAPGAEGIGGSGGAPAAVFPYGHLRVLALLCVRRVAILGDALHAAALVGRRQVLSRDVGVSATSCGHLGRLHHVDGPDLWRVPGRERGGSGRGLQGRRCATLCAAVGRRRRLGHAFWRPGLLLQAILGGGCLLLGVQHARRRADARRLRADAGGGAPGPPLRRLRGGAGAHQPAGHGRGSIYSWLDGWMPARRRGSM